MASSGPCSMGVMKTPNGKAYSQDNEGTWWYQGPRTPRVRCKVKVCEHCDEQYIVSPYHAKKSRYCTRKCAGRAQPRRPGTKASRWAGGRKKNDKGYVQVYMPDHPAASSGGRGGIYVLEHRLVMEKHLGRYLDPSEVVHHLNGIKDDNRLENLEVIDRRTHALQHRTSFEPPHCPSCTCGAS